MREITLDEAIDAFVDAKLSEVYTALPCRVVRVYLSLEECRVDIQPLINRILEDGSDKEHNVILNVPVQFPSSKTAALTYPVDVGDTVIAIFFQRDSSYFKGGSGPDTFKPNTRRKFSINDAFVIPGITPFKNSVNNPAKRKWVHSTKDVVLVNNIGSNQECEIRLKDSGNIEVKTSQDFYATFADGLIECNNLTVQATGDITMEAGGVISLSAGSNVNITSGAATDIQATTDFSVQAAQWNMTVSGVTTVNCPTTNWSGVFNLAGTLAMSGGGGGGTATINAPLQVNNSITVSGGDISADGISLKSHTHPDPQGGSTGPAQ